MKLPNWLKPRNPGRELALIGHRRQRDNVRARVDEMRANMGLEPVRWPHA